MGGKEVVMSMQKREERKEEKKQKTVKNGKGLLSSDLMVNVGFESVTSVWPDLGAVIIVVDVKSESESERKSDDES